MSSEGLNKPGVNSLRWIVVALVLALLIGAVDWLIARSESKIPLRVDCRGEECNVRVGEQPPITVQSNSAVTDNRVGLYIYNPHEQGKPQWFRAIQIRGLVDQTEIRLTDPDELGRFAPTAGWEIEPGSGLTFRGEPGARSTLMLESVHAVDFSLEAELRTARDAGVLVRGSSPGDGLVVAVRDRFNDVIVFPLDGGDPGATLGIGPVRDLSVGRESLRLAGLCSRYVVACALLLLLLVPVLRRVGSRRPNETLPRFLRRDRLGVGWQVALFVLTATALSLVAIFALGAVPHVEDETAYVFQAKVFAAGKAWAPAPPAPDFFRHEHVIRGADRWFAKYPPLFPLLLALGMTVGLPWIVNPLLGAAVALLIFKITEALSTWRWGLVAWALTVSSPFFLILGGSLMSHMTAAVLVSLALLCVIRNVQSRRLVPLSLAGFALGLAFLARPYTALLVGVAVGSWLILQGMRQRSVVAGVLAVALVALCALPGVLGFVAWSQYVVGSDSGSSNAYAAYDGTDTLGFGLDKGRGWLRTWGTWGHTPAKAIRATYVYLDYTSTHLLGWPLGLSFVFAAVCLFGARRRPGVGLLIAPFAMLIVGHGLYWATQHISYGARYWFSGLPGLMVLTALGMSELSSRPALPSGTPPRRRSTLVLGGAIVALVAWNLAVYLPQRLAELRNYAGVNADLVEVMQRMEDRPMIVFVKTEGILYNDGFQLNDPFLRQPQIFAIDLGPRNDELLALYPDRQAYRWNGKLLTPLTPHARTIASETSSWRSR